MHFVLKIWYAGDTATYWRYYYVDTANGYLVKCVLDTIFDDGCKQRFEQIVIYFNQGYEFNNWYKEKPKVNSALC